LHKADSLKPQALPPAIPAQAFLSPPPQVNAYFNDRKWPTIKVRSLLTEEKDRSGWGDVAAYE